MPISTLTHITKFDGDCERCGQPMMAEIQAAGQTILVGDRVGRITSQHAGARVYKIGENDSNQPCAPAKGAL